MNEKFVALDNLAASLGLPRRFLRQLAEQGSIPHLVVGGRLRFNETEVRAALAELARPEDVHHSRLKMEQLENNTEADGCRFVGRTLLGCKEPVKEIRVYFRDCFGNCSLISMGELGEAETLYKEIGKAIKEWKNYKGVNHA